MNKFPKRVTIEMTNDCNLSCTMCPRHFMNDTIEYINYDLWCKLVDECKEQSVTLLPFWRGESLLHPQFGELIDYALGRVKAVQFATNGTFINEENVSLLSKFDFISISIHNKAAIDKLNLLLKHLHKNKPEIQASFVESEKSCELIDAVLEKVDRVRVYKMHTNNGVYGKSNVKLSRQESCAKLMNDIVIACDGTVSRCCYLWETNKSLSVVSDSIYDVWNGTHYREIRRSYPDALCERCDQWEGTTLGKTLEKTQVN